MSRLLALAALLFALPAQAVVNIEWVTVADPGNAGDTEVMTCCLSATGTSGYGSVAYVYRIGKYEVTNAQYAEFLNAVAAADTNALYNTNMGSVPHSGGITRSGSPGSYSYSAIAGRENMPVNWITFWDAMRFANWLHNGQPTGAQDNSTTEDGAYTLTPEGIANNTVTRNVGATAFVPSEDEWYKAAYYDPVSNSYFDYPAGSDTPPTCAAPGATANSANCGAVVGDLTDVGSYTGAASPYGTFDQGGNVIELTETIIADIGFRRARGGYFNDSPNVALSARHASLGGPSSEWLLVGFRVASRDYPVPALNPLGLFLVAASLLGFGVYRRGRA